MFNKKVVVVFLICLTFSSVVFAAEDFFRLFATKDGKENQINEVNKNTFAPRLGFAWSPKFQGGFLNNLIGAGDATVIRGGYAIYYDQFLAEKILKTFPIVQNTIFIGSNGIYTLGPQKVVNSIRPTDPFTFGLEALAANRFGTIYNKNQNLIARIFGPTQNPLGGPITLFKNSNPAGIHIDTSCITQSKYAFLARSNTAGNLLVLDDHNNGRPIPGTPPTVFRFTGSDFPISIGCWEDVTNRVLTLFFQNYRQQGNNRPQVRATGRQFRYDNTTFNPVGPQRSYDPFTFIDSQHAFKFRLNTVTGVDRNENGRADAVCFVKPTTNGSDMFCRGIDENTIAPKTPPKKVSPTVPGPKFYWNLRFLPPPEFRF